MSPQDTQLERVSESMASFDKFEQHSRVISNQHISNLASKIMELILDNIRVVHLNAKLSQYLKKLAEETASITQEKQQV